MTELMPTVSSSAGTITSNLEMIKADTAEMLKRYTGRVYTAEEILAAKRDRAALNNRKAELDTARKKVKAEYCKPLSEFEEKVKEITTMIDSVSKSIDSQVKEYEALEKSAKYDRIANWWADHGDKNFSVDQVIEASFLKKTTTDDYWQSMLQMKAYKIKREILELSQASTQAERDYLLADYLKCMSIDQCRADWSAYSERIANVQSAPAAPVEHTANVVDKKNEGTICRVVRITGTKDSFRQLMGWCNEHDVIVEKIDI